MFLRSVRATLGAAARHFSENAIVSEGGSAAKGGGKGRDTLGKRLFRLAFAKRSAAIALRKWKEEGHSVGKHQLRRILVELRKHKQYKHALEVCEWMMQEKDMKILPGDYAIHLDLIAKVHGLDGAERFFEGLPDTLRGMQTYNALLHTYVQNNLLEKSEALMEKMSEYGFENPFSYNYMLSLYVKNRRFEKVPELIQELRKNTTLNVYTYNIWLTACAAQNDIEAAEAVFGQMRKAGIDPEWVNYSKLANLYIKKELHDKAASTLKNMEKMASRKNRTAYSSLLSLHTNMGNKDDVHRIWNTMKSHFRKMSDIEYDCMIFSLVKLGEFEEAKKLYVEWESVSPTGNPKLANNILAAYVNKNQMEEAENFHKHMIEKKIPPCYTTWVLLTYGHLKTKQMDKVLDCFKKSIGSVKKWNPDEKLIREIFMNIEEQGNTKAAEQLLVILRNAGCVTTEIYNCLLRTYEKAGKMPLIVGERMKKDKVKLDEETHKLIQITSDMPISEALDVLS